MKNSIVVGFIVPVVVVASLASSQPSTGPAGHWEGAIQTPGQELKVEVDLAKTGDKWEGTIAVPAQNLTGFPLSDIAVQGDTVSFAMKGVPGEPQFKGSVSKDGKSWSGEFIQGGVTMTFALVRTGEAKIEPAPKSTPITQELEGSWEGALDVEGKTLRLVLKLSNQPERGGAGTLTSLDQGGAEIPILAVVQNGSHLQLLVRSVGGTYEGDLKDGRLVGTWTQGPRSLPLIFSRSKP